MLHALTEEEREDFLRDMMAVMPPAQFAAVAGWIRAGLPADEWQGLTGHVVELRAFAQTVA